MDDANDHARPTDEPQPGDITELQLIWQSAPAACARCSRDLDAPRPVAKLGDELLCYHCLFPLLRPDYVMSTSQSKDLEAAPDAAILWWNEPGTCCACDQDLKTPGPVGVVPEGAVCIVCLEREAPTLSWILRLATAVRQAQGYWPGAPRYQRKRPPGWRRGNERPDWSHAKKTGRWPSAIWQCALPFG